MNQFIRKLPALTTSLLLATLMLLTACATQPRADTYYRGQSLREQTVEFGIVDYVRVVNIEPGDTRVGTVTGAILGGIAGSTIGGGRRAHTAGAVAGAVAGGAIGGAIQRSNVTPGIELTIRLESGRNIAIVQAGHPDEFRVGDRVRVTSDGRTTRVSR